MSKALFIWNVVLCFDFLMGNHNSSLGQDQDLPPLVPLTGPETGVVGGFVSEWAGGFKKSLLAFMCGEHPRLGKDSVIQWLPYEVLLNIIMVCWNIYSLVVLTFVSMPNHPYY